MLNYFGLSKKKENEFDLEATYMRIQFLTQDEKILKDSAFKLLDKQFEEDLQTIIPYQSSFTCSYRYMFNAGKIKAKISLSQVMALLEASTDEGFQQFYETNVQKIKLHMKDNKLVNQSDVLELYNQRDVGMYTPPEILQVIYVKKGLLNRMKIKSMKFVKNIPKMCMNLVMKFFMMILRFLGLGSGQSIIMKFVPLKFVVQWVLNIVMIVCPALAPFIGVGKMLI